MSKIDNFKLIEDCINLHPLESSDEFYFVQIIRRKKDGNENVSNNKKDNLISHFLIDISKNLSYYEEKIKLMCETFNARAYINVNKRSYIKASKLTLTKSISDFTEGNYKAISRNFLHACGSSESIINKNIWILDVDNRFDSYENYLEILESLLKDNFQFIKIIPTVNGYHILTPPFYKMKFWGLCYTNKIVQPEIKVNSSTLLYFK
jgi:hypothetical protein